MRARALGRPEPGALRYLAQVAGVALAWSFAGSAGFAWSRRRSQPRGLLEIWRPRTTAASR